MDHLWQSGTTYLWAVNNFFASIQSRRTQRCCCCASIRYYVHPDSPQTGSQWMKQYILFNKLKITNSPVQNPNHVSIDLLHRRWISVRSLRSQIILNSMHRYMPRLHIVQASDSYSIRSSPLSTFVFEETAFIAVTAYQNDQVRSNEPLKEIHSIVSRRLSDHQAENQ